MLASRSLYLWERYAYRVGDINTTLRPLQEASHSKEKSPVKSNTSKISVVHMASFKAKKSSFVASFHTKELFLRKVFNRVAICP